MDDRRPIPDALQFLNRAFLEGECERERLESENRALQERVTQLSLAQETHDTYEADLLRRIGMLELALKRARNGEEEDTTFDALDLPARLISRTASQSGTKEEGLDISEDDDLLDDDAFDRAINELSAGEEQPAELEMPRQAQPVMIQRSKSAPVSQVPAVMQRSHSAPSGSNQRMPSDTLSRTAGAVGGHRPYKVRETLRGHMDGVRALAFHPAQPLLVSGSEDGTVKLWDLRHAERQKGVSSSDHKRNRQVDPRLTYRGHVGAVFAVRIGRCLGDSVCVSAGIDATIRVWLLSDPLESDSDSSSYSNGEGFPFSQV
jgi:WD40 repeat protein